MSLPSVYWGGLPRNPSLSFWERGDHPNSLKAKRGKCCYFRHYVAYESQLGQKLKKCFRFFPKFLLL
jgi:hypothetical protein